MSTNSKWAARRSIYSSLPLTTRNLCPLPPSGGRRIRSSGDYTTGAVDTPRASGETVAAMPLALRLLPKER
jgi:hypothetical protein